MQRTARPRSQRALLTAVLAAPWLAVALAVASAVACAGGDDESGAEASPPPAQDAAGDAPRLLEGLGDHHHAISTSVPLAQRYFDQGLILTFGFNHEAAVRSFEEAGRLDPDCAMCAWGVALALGPNINAPMGPDAGRRAWAAAQEARARAERSPRTTPEERAYVEALTLRYAPEPPEDRAALDRAYADAMEELHRTYPDDVDAAVLLAEALMDLTPWDYYTKDGTPRERTPEILALLEGAMQREPDHVGANHYYIHAVEEFTPEKGVAAAERLRSLAPDAGHLVHMPAHIFWRVGRYDEAVEINERAAAADEAFFAWCQPVAFYRAAYYPHNLHFLWAAAAAEGRSEIALTTARRLEAATARQVDEFDFVEEFLSIPMLTLARFGHWDAALGEPRPDPARPYLTGIWHYVRGLARVRRGELDDASTELAALRAAAEAPAAKALVIAGGTAPASQLLAIGVAHLEGELAAAHGDLDAAIAALERAVERQDALVYMEPPPWYFPTRQALGAVLLDAGRPEQAEAVYREDLKHYRANGWSLYGLAASLRAQGRTTDAAFAERGFHTAFARADVELHASRF